MGHSSPSRTHAGMYKAFDSISSGFKARKVTVSGFAVVVVCSWLLAEVKQGQLDIRYCIPVPGLKLAKLYLARRLLSIPYRYSGLICEEVLWLVNDGASTAYQLG